VMRSGGAKNHSTQNEYATFLIQIRRDLLFVPSSERRTRVLLVVATQPQGIDVYFSSSPRAFWPKSVPRSGGHIVIISRFLAVLSQLRMFRMSQSMNVNIKLYA